MRAPSQWRSARGTPAATACRKAIALRAPARAARAEDALCCQIGRVAARVAAKSARDARRSRTRARVERASEPAVARLACSARRVACAMRRFRDAPRRVRVCAARGDLTQSSDRVQGQRAGVVNAGVLATRLALSARAPCAPTAASEGRALVPRGRGPGWERAEEPVRGPGHEPARAFTAAGARSWPRAGRRAGRRARSRHAPLACRTLRRAFSSIQAPLCGTKLISCSIPEGTCSSRRSAAPPGCSQLCAGYFFFYVVTGVLVKFFTGSLHGGAPRLSDMAFLVNNTVGGNLLCLVAVFALGWIPWPSKHGGRWPRETALHPRLAACAPPSSFPPRRCSTRCPSRSWSPW